MKPPQFPVKGLKKITKRSFLCIVWAAVFFSGKILTAEEKHGSIINDVSWQSVLGGNVLCAPKRTSYGFAALSEGKILSACTGNGTVIWRRRLNEEASPFYTVSKEDFIYLVSADGMNLYLYNPDGILLWQCRLIEKAVSPPLCGRDGRVFIAGKNSVSCYGTQGTKKWTLSLPAAGSFNLTEMNDGSILYIQQEKKGEADTGKRISPYGEVLEDIVFKGELSVLSSAENTLIIGLKTGTAGFISVREAETKTVRSIPPLANKAVPQTVISGKEEFCILYSDASLCSYDLKTGTLLWEAQNPQLKAGALQTEQHFYTVYENGTYHFAYTEKSGTYTVSYDSKSGKITGEKMLRTQKDARFPLITSSLYLIVCGNKWIVSGYDLKNKEHSGALQNLNPAKNIGSTTYNFKTENKRFYASSYERTADIAAALKQGDFGTKEYGYKRRIQNDLNDYRDEYAVLQKRSSVNTAAKINTLSLIERFETADFNYAVPLFLKNETEPALFAAALHCAGKLGYDPDGTMLEAVEHLYEAKKTSLGDAVLIELAESVYSLCRYMGRPAFIKRGKAILSDMLSLRTRDGMLQTRVREIMFRFIELEN